MYNLQAPTHACAEGKGFRGRLIKQGRTEGGLHIFAKPAGLPYTLHFTLGGGASALREFLETVCHTRTAAEGPALPLPHLERKR